jgi:5-methylcytosine-specific restriction protein A
MTVLNQHYIAAQATKRYDISFEGSESEYDGEILKVIRPRDIPLPNGFAIAISKTTRVIEASFKADNFSGSLLRRMGDVEESKIRDFVSSIKNLENSFNVEFTVNTDVLEDVSKYFTGEKWAKIEFICEKRLDGEVKNDQVKLDLVASNLITNMLDSILILLEVEEISDVVPLFEAGLPEGSKRVVEVNKYERSPINRARCLAYHGFNCKACNHNFSDKYGPIGDEYIEVHHIIKVSEMGAGYIVDPINDLIPLCSNCHAIVHRRDPPLTVEGLVSLLSNPKAVSGEQRYINIEPVEYE